MNLRELWVVLRFVVGLKTTYEYDAWGITVDGQWVRRVRYGLETERWQTPLQAARKDVEGSGLTVERVRVWS